MDRKRISVSLSEKLAEKLEETIKESGLSASEIVRAALYNYFKKEEGEHGRV